MLPDSFRKYPKAAATIAVLIFLFGTFPVWLATVWPLFSTEPFPNVMARHGWGLAVVGPLYGWIAVAIGLLCVGLLSAILFDRLPGAKDPPLRTPVDPRTREQLIVLYRASANETYS